LNELENKLDRVKNYHVTNKEVGNKIIFLRKLAPGGSVHSFGIHVGTYGGDATWLNRTSQRNFVTAGRKQGWPRRWKERKLNENIKQLNMPKMQLSIFDEHSATFEEIRNLLNAVDINRLTPVEALLKLQEVKAKVK
jgi:DNA mismatch repair protein MutS